MNQISKIFLLPAAFFCFAACSNDDGFAPAQGDGSGSPVVVRAAVGEGGIYTRTNPMANDDEGLTTFDAGDRICITDITNRANHVAAEYVVDAEGVWRPANTMLKWQQKTENEFVAYYPVEGRNTVERLFVKTDQSTLQGLKASDVMNCYKESVDVPANHMLNVEFTRRTARLVVEIASYRDQYNATDNPVTALTVSGCYTDHRESLGRGTQISDIQAYKVPEATQRQQFVALTCGAAADADARFLTLKVKNSQGGEDELTVGGVPEFSEGKSYTMRLIVGKDNAQVASVTVNPWNGATELVPGGEAVRRGKRLTSPYVNADDIGKIVGSDGYIYDDRADADAFDATPVAMVAYVGTDTGDPEHTHGLAFALTGTQPRNRDMWSTFESYKANTPVPDGAGEWRVPSNNDLKWHIFPAFKGGENNFGTFYDQLMACGSNGIKSLTGFLKGPTIYVSDQAGGGYNNTFTFRYMDSHTGGNWGAYDCELRCIFPF